MSDDQEERDRVGVTAEEAAVALIATGAGMVNPAAGLAAAGLLPFVSYASHRLLQAARRKRIESGEAVLEKAILGADVSAEEFVARIESDPKRLQLAARAIEAGRRAYTENHIKALALALAKAATADTSEDVDRELLIVNALADLEEAHVFLLQSLAQEAARLRTGPAVPLDAIDVRESFFRSRFDEPDRPLMVTLLLALIRVGAVSEWGLDPRMASLLGRPLTQVLRQQAVSVGRAPSHADVQRTWRVTEFGLLLLEYLDMASRHSAG